MSANVAGECEPAVKTETSGVGAKERLRAGTEDTPRLGEEIPRVGAEETSRVVPAYTSAGVGTPTGFVPPTSAVQSVTSSRGGKRKKATRAEGPPAKSRRSLPGQDSNIKKPILDSGSEDDDEDNGDGTRRDGDDVTGDTDHSLLRDTTRLLREVIIQREERDEDNDREERDGVDRMRGIHLLEDIVNVPVNVLLTVEDENAISQRWQWNDDMHATNERNETEPSVSTDFQWSEDFSTFTGQRETYQREPGPTFYSEDPCEIFLQIWNAAVMGIIATETNKYAAENMAPYRNPDNVGNSPKYLDRWHDVTIGELYRYFAMLIYMSIFQRSKIQDYWMTGFLGMPEFRKAMPRNTFLLISKFLHFVSNKDITGKGYARKIAKVAPVLDHCNKIFSELYIPAQHISLDESLLLWKGSLNWRQCIRSKAARFGIKSFELCEAATGYLLQCRLYIGKDTVAHPEPLHGFTNKTADVVLDLMEGYLDVGHILVMDSWYNQLALTRYLKSRRTDVLGSMARGRKDVPQDIKDLNPNHVARGEWVARHCGDIALVAWKDVKLATVLSTFHRHEMVLGKSAGQVVKKPVAVKEYNQYMGGIDRKDQKLSMFLFERGNKWYMKVFRRLLNTSLLNAFIIYTKNPKYRTCSHRDFRMKVAEGLLIRFPNDSPLPHRIVTPSVQPRPLRLQPGNHCPDYTPIDTSRSKAKHKRMRCVRCTFLKKRTLGTLMCKLCQAPLCIGKCWQDYHEYEDLSKVS